MSSIKLVVESDLSNVDSAFSKAHKTINDTNDEVQKFGKTAKESSGIATNEMKQFDAQTKAGTKDMKDLTKAAEGLGKSGTDGVKKINAEIKTTAASAKSFKDTLSSNVAGFVTANVITGGLAKIGQGFTNALNVQKEFEKSLKNLQAITGASEKDVSFYAEAAKKMGLSIEGGAVAAVEAFKLIGSAKPELLANKEALVEVTEAAVTLSKASGLALPEAAEHLGNALNSFGADAKDANKFINVLAASAQLGAKEIPFVTFALSKFGGVAASAGVSIEQSASAIEILGAKIPDASSVGTNLRGILVKLQISAKESGREFLGLSKELELLAPHVKDVTFLKKRFSEENILSIQTLINEREALDKMTAGVTGTSSALEQAAINTDTLSQKTLEAGNAWDKFTLSLSNGKAGGFLKTVVEGFTNTLDDFANALNGTYDTQKDIINLQSSFNANRKNTTKLTEDQSKALIGFGLALSSNSGNYKEATKGAVEYLLITDQIVAASKAEGSSDEVRLNTIAALRKDSEVFIKQFKDGSLNANEFAVKINIIKDQISKLKAPKVLNTELELPVKPVIDEKAIAEAKKLREDLAKALEELEKKARKSSVDQLKADTEEKVLAQKALDLQEIEELRNQIIKKGKLTNSGFKLGAEQEAQFGILRQEIESESSQKILDIRTKEAEKQLQITKKAGDDEIKLLDSKTELKISFLESQSAPEGSNEVEFEKVKQLAILKVKRDAAIESLDIKQKAIDLEAQVQINANKENESAIRAQAEVDKDIILQKTQDTINAVNAEIEKQNKKPPFSLAALFGINDPSKQQQFYNSLKEIGKNIQQILSGIAQENINAIQKEIDASKAKEDQIKAELDTLNASLDEEQKLKSEGLANDTDRIKQQIAQKEAEAAAEKAREAELLEERKKQQKIKLAIDSATQISNIVTAGTTLFAKGAFAGPLGIATAAATITGMLASMLALRQQIKAQSEGFAEGGYTGDGGKYTEAGVVHRGEYVITKEKTAKNRSLLEGLHTDNPELIQKGIFDLLKNTGVALPDSKNISNKRALFDSYTAANTAKKDTQLDDIKKELIEIKAKFADVIKGQDKEIYNKPDGTLVKKSGSHTTIIKSGK